MKFTTKKLHVFLFFKLPSAFWCGVRVDSISEARCVTRVRLTWFNKNPFKSLYFAVQAMAAELSTGVLVMSKIQHSNQKISMLVTQCNAKYSKKAIGKITFTCSEGTLVDHKILKAIETKEGQTFWMKAIGVDEQGDQVSEFNFEWSVKLK